MSGFAAAAELDGCREFLSRRSQGFVELLSFEAATPELFDAKLPASGVPYWSVVRFTVARLIGDALFGTRTVQNSSPSQSSWSVAAFFGRCLVSNPWRARRARSRIVFCSSSVGNSRRANGYFNRLSDYFAGMFAERTTVLETPHGRRYFFPRTFANTLCLAGVQIVARAAARLTPPTASDHTQIDRFVDLLRGQFGHWLGEEQWRYLGAMLRAQVSSDRWQVRLYSNLLERLQPALLVIEDGCYGNWGSLIRCAKLKGIHVAEYQHGLVSCNHEAYNYLPQTFAKVRDVLPDTFLAYGRYWADQISIPSTVRIVGNPHLSDSLDAGVQPQSPSASRSLMLATGGLDSADYQRIALEFLQHAPPEWNVILRPHPSRRTSAAGDYSLLAGHTRFKLDLSTDYYEALRAVEVVVGDASTAVMEAAAFGKRVLLIDHPEVQRNYPGIFPVFADGAELVALLAERSSAAELPEVDSIWAGDWRASYSSFVNEVVGGHGETR